MSSPPYSVSDTLGYAALKHKSDSLYVNYRGYKRYLHGEEEDLYYEKMKMIKEAKEKGFTLEQYCDSLNKNVYHWRAKQYVGKKIDRLRVVLYCSAKNRVYLMAPLIEEYGQPYFSDIEIQEMLARLDYKDYKTRQEAYDAQQVVYYTQQIDSLSKILFSIDEYTGVHYGFGSQSEKAHDELSDVFRSLRYIGTQESYYTMAPLLLIKTKVINPHYFGNILNYTVGIDFYNEIARLLKDVPLPQCVNRDYFNLKELYSDGECKEIEAYIPKVYQWMIDNKGKYELQNLIE